MSRPAREAPAATTPAVTMPAVTTPAATTPAATTPAATTPAATTPAATTPAATTPAATIPTTEHAPLGARPHILVLEDDRRIASLLARYLFEHGYLPLTLARAEDARRLMAQSELDAAIVDVMLPGEDGLSFVRGLRATGPRPDLPVLILTARGGTDDRIAGLEVGADDYLPKPFDPRELVLRLEAILRRAPRARPDPRLRLGLASYDPATGAFSIAGRAERLPDSEARLLRLLAARPGEAVRRAALAEASGIAERSVDVQIVRLRRRLEVDPTHPQVLLTVRGAGYVLQPGTSMERSSA